MIPMNTHANNQLNILDTFTASELADYRARVIGVYGDYDFVQDYADNMNTAKNAVFNSQMIANRIAGYDPLNSDARMSAHTLRQVLCKLETEAYLVRGGR